MKRALRYAMGMMLAVVAAVAAGLGGYTMGLAECNKAKSAWTADPIPTDALVYNVQ